MNRDFIDPIIRSLDILSKKWTVEILAVLMDSPKRFSEITQYIPDVSHKMLSFRLKELMELNLLTKFIINILPLKISYGLSESAASLSKLFLELGKFSFQLQNNDNTQYLSQIKFEKWFQN